MKMPTKSVNGVTYFYRKDSFLSNHYLSNFTYKGKSFCCVEQFYFYCKALVNKDLISADAIYNTRVAAKMMKINKLMLLSEYAEWSDQRAINIMSVAVNCKFSQSKIMRNKLLGTEDNLIVEASRHLFWGIGVDINSQFVCDRRFWKGRNNLGKVLMSTREKLRLATNNC